jgi:hypothetical protein
MARWTNIIGYVNIIGAVLVGGLVGLWCGYWLVRQFEVRCADLIVRTEYLFEADAERCHRRLREVESGSGGAHPERSPGPSRAGG